MSREAYNRHTKSLENYTHACSFRTSLCTSKASSAHFSQPKFELLLQPASESSALKSSFIKTSRTQRAKPLTSNESKRVPASPTTSGMEALLPAITGRLEAVGSNNRGSPGTLIASQAFSGLRAICKSVRKPWERHLLYLELNG